MHRVSSTIRITIGLTGLSVTVLLLAQSTGLTTDRSVLTLVDRAALCESISISCSLLAQTGGSRAIESCLRANLDRNPDITSIGLRRADGSDVARFGNQDAPPQPPSTTEHGPRVSSMVVPVVVEGTPWGEIEFGFRPLTQSGISGILTHPVTKHTLFVACVGFFVYFFYLRTILQQLDPFRVIPGRVRATLDTLVEGLLILDKKGRIVLANTAFARTVGRSPANLQGYSALDFAWVDHGKGPAALPWMQAVRDGKTKSGVMLDLETTSGQRLTFTVNASPIIGEDGECRGALASFNDVTPLERNRAQLRAMLKKLRISRDEVQHKNMELEFLAKRDPLTSCLNRRSFYERFEAYWDDADRYEHPLSCVMLDIDRFKSINDGHGHSVGDRVIQKVAGILLSTVRAGDVVCRYGGEEFCVLMPHVDLDQAGEIAERYRVAIEKAVTTNLRVTVSVGVSATSLGATEPRVLLDQADRALYVAKRNGRNQVCRWDEVLDSSTSDGSGIAQVTQWRLPEDDPPIPFHAVAALVSALAYRDASTAEHSRRVADLCVATANRLMPIGDAYVVEIAALLHDTGKIGVPDSILRKPGPLTDEEWDLMRDHDRISVEIIKSSIDSDKLTSIVENHHAWYGGNPRNPELATGEDIPLGARILAIADAFDAMVSDRIYRGARSQEDAIAELRQCAGVQFDPNLVESFIQVIQTRDNVQTGSTTEVSRQLALKIGSQIENLASSLDSKNISDVTSLATRLKIMATRGGADSIAEAASDLESAIANQSDETKILELANGLLNLCRSTQTAFLSYSEEVGMLAAPSKNRNDDGTL